MNTISKHQIFCLMIIFEIGSTTLFALGIKAKQDAWIVILVAMIIGLGFTWLYTELQKAFPKKNYIEILNIVLGKWVGTPLALLYTAFWLWPAARNVREFGELIILTLLPNTPLFVIILLFVLISLYVLLLGNQVLARTSEITMPLIVFSILLLHAMVFISGNVNPQNILPVMGSGVKTILKTAYPNVAIFPFGEILIFSMYWHYLDDKTVIRKSTMYAIIFSGLMLSFTLAMYVCVLGPEYSSISTIPFIVVIKMINIGEFLTNLDSIAIGIMFLGGFYKMSIYTNGITMALATIFKIKNYKVLLPFFLYIFDYSFYNF